MIVAAIMAFVSLFAFAVGYVLAVVTERRLQQERWRGFHILAHTYAHLVDKTAAQCAGDNVWNEEFSDSLTATLLVATHMMLVGHEVLTVEGTN